MAQFSLYKGSRFQGKSRQMGVCVFLREQPGLGG